MKKKILSLVLILMLICVMFVLTGLRVLVCLKSSATATKNDEGIWVLE